MILKLATPALAVAGLLFTGSLVLKQSRAEPAPAHPPVAPAEPPFTSFVAAPGLTEASTDNIAIGSPIGAIVKQIHVTVGDAVKKVTPSFNSMSAISGLNS